MVEFHNHHGLCGRRAAEREFVKIAGSTHGEGEGEAMHRMERGVYASYGRRAAHHHIEREGESMHHMEGESTH